MSEGQPPGPSSPPAETVELYEDEHVVNRGSATTHWLVRDRDSWTPAVRMPGARVEEISPGPGVVWRRRVQLTLPRGALLQCVRSAPQLVGKSPLAYLESKPFTSRRVRRTLHRVGRGGTLVADPPRSS